MEKSSLPKRKPYWEFLLKPPANIFNIRLVFHLTHINSGALPITLMVTVQKQEPYGCFFSPQLKSPHLPHMCNTDDIFFLSTLTSLSLPCYLTSQWRNPSCISFPFLWRKKKSNHISQFSKETLQRHMHLWLRICSRTAQSTSNIAFFFSCLNIFLPFPVGNFTPRVTCNYSLEEQQI